MAKLTKRRRTKEIIFCETILKTNPYCLPVLRYLAEQYTALGRYELGCKIDLLLVELIPEDPIAHYNLACSLALLGREEQALKELIKAYILGYDNIDFMLKDADLENIKKLPEFYDFLNKVKKDILLLREK